MAPERGGRKVEDIVCGFTAFNIQEIDDEEAHKREN
jgi:hypothetical protein